MRVLMFQPRFAALVASGVKTQTVRVKSKAKHPRPLPTAGERLSLREWTGKPYHSPQRVIAEAVCLDVRRVSIRGASENGLAALYIDGAYQDIDASLAFAWADGFQWWSEMADWFRDTHGLPFEGVAIRWEKPEGEPNAE